MLTVRVDPKSNRGAHETAGKSERPKPWRKPSPKPQIRGPRCEVWEEGTPLSGTSGRRHPTGSQVLPGLRALAKEGPRESAEQTPSSGRFRLSAVAAGKRRVADKSKEGRFEVEPAKEVGSTSECAATVSVARAG